MYLIIIYRMGVSKMCNICVFIITLQLKQVIINQEKLSSVINMVRLITVEINTKIDVIIMFYQCDKLSTLIYMA